MLNFVALALLCLQVTNASAIDDLCQGDPCVNGGTCVYVDNETVSCTCPPGFEGVFCETKLSTDVVTVLLPVSETANSTSVSYDTKADVSDAGTTLGRTTGLSDLTITTLSFESTPTSGEAPVTRMRGRTDIIRVKTEVANSTSIFQQTTFKPVSPSSSALNVADACAIQVTWAVNVMTAMTVQVQCVCSTNFSGELCPYHVQGMCNGNEYSVGETFSSLVRNSICKCPEEEFSDLYCEKASQVIVNKVTSTTASLSWTALAGNPSYKIYYTGPDGVEYNVTNELGETYTKLMNLIPGSSYTVRVVASYQIREDDVDVGTANLTTTRTKEKGLPFPGILDGGTCSLNVTWNVSVVKNMDSFECVCHSRKGQYYCGHTPQDLCYSLPSQSRMSDTVSELIVLSMCQCSDRFIGYCSQEYPCRSNPCPNGSTCLNSNNGTFRCTFPPGSIEIPCNGAHCMTTDASEEVSPLTTASEEVSPLTTAWEKVSPLTKASEQVSPLTTALEKVSPLTKASEQISPLIIGMLVISGVAFALCIPMSILLHRCYRRTRELKATSSANHPEHDIVGRMSSANFANPAYQSDKDLPNTPPPIRPRPVRPLHADNEQVQDLYAEYIYIDRPEAHAQADFTTFPEGPTESDPSGTGEYIYVVEPVEGKSSAYAFDKSGKKLEGPKLPSLPPPSAGEYIYFDYSESSKTQAESEEYIYVDEPPTQMTSTGKPPTTNPNSFGSKNKQTPPIASVRPLPLKPTSTPIENDEEQSNMINKNENLYQELPQGNHDGMANIKNSLENTATSVGVLQVDIELDSDLYLQPDCIAK